MPDASNAEILAGGVANAGSVVRVGDQVLRPSNRYTASVHAHLGALRSAGFDGASDPLGVDADGRERLVFIPGEVAVPPYPEWVQTDDALVSIAELMAGMHRASAASILEGFDPSAHEWSDEMADPAGGPVVCHNDVCLENVVFRDSRAAGLLDFDFCAPGRPARDVAAFARMCVPVDDDVNAARNGWHDADRPARLALVADAHELDRDGRALLLDCLDHDIAHGGEFVLRHVEAGEPGFVAMWEAMGGMERFDRRREWWAGARASFAAALATPRNS